MSSNNNSGLNTLSIVLSLLAINITLIRIANNDPDKPSLIEKLRAIPERELTYWSCVIYGIIVFIIIFVGICIYHAKKNKKGNRKRDRWELDW